ncbi:UNVERIFIED_CONTAM: hypothetical protein GTU68_055508 [Idotea baltica]|nr:hypothetical protein [Idotea baltica]
MRRLVRFHLEKDSRLKVVGEASSAEAARPMIKALNPDVLTLDVEMPGIGGISFLGHLMRLRPMPVVMVSSLTQAGSDFAIQALSLGAVECVAKPGIGKSSFSEDLAELVFQAAHSRQRPRNLQPSHQQSDKPGFSWNGKLLLIGASTGGVEALERVLSSFPPDCPPTLISQHMPESFLRSFAKRLNDGMSATVKLACDKEKLQKGHIYLAPGAERIARDVIAILLTGMGRDGAYGMKQLWQAGAHTIAQNEETSVVFGMPRVAIELGAVADVLPLEAIAECALSKCSRSVS